MAVQLKEIEARHYRKFWDEELETLARPARQQLQLRLLKRTLELAYHGSPYYKRSFDEAGVKPSDVKRLEDLQKFPFINKHVVRARQEAAPPFGDLVPVPEEEIVYISASSGSTGMPTASPFTGADFDAWMDYEARQFWSSGMRPTDRYCHALNFSLFVGGPCVMGAQKLGALCIHAGTIPSDRLLAVFQQFQPTVTWTTPSYAWYLGETALKAGLDPASDLSIRRIFVAGEPGGSVPVTRERIQELWGAKVYDYYGLSDLFGSCAGECEAQAGLHFAEDHMIVEVLDPETQQPVAEGERGELVLTSIKKDARPMIRFRTGDIVSVTTEPCTCGRTAIRMNGVHGRLDDMLIIKGVNVFPSDIEHITRRLPELTGEYRLVVERVNHLDALTVQVEHTPDYLSQGGELASLAARVTREIHKVIGISPKVEVLAPETLPRATHKAKRVLDNRGNVWGA